MESFLGKRGTTLSPHYVPGSQALYRSSQLGSCRYVARSLSLQCQPRAASRRRGPSRSTTRRASSFVVAIGRPSLYVYFEEPGPYCYVTKRLTKDEAAHGGQTR